MAASRFAGVQANKNPGSLYWLPSLNLLRRDARREVYLKRTKAKKK
jgi:hypothetical protein